MPRAPLLPVTCRRWWGAKGKRPLSHPPYPHRVPHIRKRNEKDGLQHYTRHKSRRDTPVIKSRRRDRTIPVLPITTAAAVAGRASPALLLQPDYIRVFPVSSNIRRQVGVRERKGHLMWV